jgi:hypothetical protein
MAKNLCDPGTQIVDLLEESKYYPAVRIQLYELPLHYQQFLIKLKDLQGI